MLRNGHQNIRGVCKGLCKWNPLEPQSLNIDKRCLPSQPYFLGIIEGVIYDTVPTVHGSEACTLSLPNDPVCIAVAIILLPLMIDVVQMTMFLRAFNTLLAYKARRGGDGA